MSQSSVKQALDVVLPIAASQSDFALTLSAPGPGEGFVVLWSPTGPVIRSARRQSRLRAIEQARADALPTNPDRPNLSSSVADLIRAGAITVTS
jgi:hypothetical protein